eukprot:1393099-Pleurochrysis_carterae.AAC.1
MKRSYAVMMRTVREARSNVSGLDEVAAATLAAQCGVISRNFQECAEVSTEAAERARELQVIVQEIESAVLATKRRRLAYRHQGVQAAQQSGVGRASVGGICAGSGLPQEHEPTRTGSAQQTAT